jgi:hypothetical protein
VRAEYLLDTVILVDHLNGIEKATAWLQGLLDGQAVVSVITRAEVLSGVSEGEEGKIQLLLDSYPCLEIRKNTADKAAELRRREKWKLPDALQASLCLLNELRLVTRNARDFDPEKHEFVVLPYTL